MSSVRYFAGAVMWGAVTKLFEAGTRFFTIPLLLHHFGKVDFGLLALATATNAYMQLMDMGINIGATKQFSQWLQAGERDKLHKAARASVSFYVLIGLVNALILLVVGRYSGTLFHLQPEQVEVFRQLLYVICGFSMVTWASSVGNQLLMADHGIALVEQINFARGILTMVLVGLTLWLDWGVVAYFTGLIFLNAVMFVPLMGIPYRRGLLGSILPTSDWTDFKVIFRYSLAIFAMGIFQFTATQSRPIVLGMFNHEGPRILTDYRIMEVFPLFALSLGGMALNILLPTSARAVQNRDQALIETIAYNGTRLTAILLCFLCVPLALVSQDLLGLYVGPGFGHLAFWLSLWCVTILVTLHDFPVSSLILSVGRTKELVVTSAIACTVSIVVNAVLAPRLGAASAVVGYVVYVLLHFLFTYGYIMGRVLTVRPAKVLVMFLLPSLEAVSLGVAVRLSFEPMAPGIPRMLLMTGTWALAFAGTLLLLHRRSVMQLLRREAL